MDKPPAAGGAATNVSMANQKWQRMLRQARLEKAMLRKAGGARKKKGPMATFGGALGAGAKSQRKNGIVTDQREFLLPMNEELRWKEGEEERRRKGVGFWWAVWGSTLSEEGRRVTAELLNVDHHRLHPTIGQLRGLPPPGLASELPGMPVVQLPWLAMVPDKISYNLYHVSDSAFKTLPWWSFYTLNPNSDGNRKPCRVKEEILASIIADLFLYLGAPFTGIWSQP